MREIERREGREKSEELRRKSRETIRREIESMQKRTLSHARNIHLKWFIKVDDTYYSEKEEKLYSHSIFDCQLVKEF